MINRITLLLFIGLVFWSCGSDSNIKQEGYYKDKSKDRIYTFSIQSTVSKDEVKKHAIQRMNTAGKMTACYYFYDDERIPRHGLTMANNIFQANYVINKYSENIKYAYIKNYQGKIKFVDCEKNPNDDLCINHND